jgi:hypothetical protein
MPGGSSWPADRLWAFEKRTTTGKRSVGRSFGRSVGRSVSQSVSRSVRAPNVNSLPSNNTMRTLTTVQQIMREFSDAESEVASAMSITKLVLYLMKMGTRIHRPQKS